MEFREKITFFLVHLLFNCQQRWVLCSLSLMEKVRIVAELCSICSMSWLVMSQLVSVKLRHLCVMFPDKILMLCPLWQSLNRCCSFTLHPQGVVTTVGISDTFRPCRRPSVPAPFLKPLPVITPFWLVQLATVSEFQDNWQVLVSQVWRARLCCRDHWTVKLSKWITPGSSHRELDVGEDGWWRSHSKTAHSKN